MTHALPEAIRRHVDGQSGRADTVGLSGAQVLMYPGAVLKIRPDSELSRRERLMLRWLSGRCRTPEIIESVQENGQDYLLMTRMNGRMLCEDEYLDHPELLCRRLAEGMTLLHRADASSCPVRRDLDVMLAEAETRVAAGLCIPEGHDGFGPSENLLKWLLRNRPEEQLVLTHGDYCLPNVLADECGVCGLIDLGDSGLADPYVDYALGYQSLVRNLTGMFGGPVRPVPDKRLLFGCLGIEPDWDKLQYYLLLDQLFW